MASVAQEIPKVGLVMETVKVIRWLKKVGETVKQGEPLVEVETEKSIVEIEATASGTLQEILLQVDQEGKVGDQIAWIESAEPPAGDRIRSSPVARKLAAEHGVDLGTVTGSGPRGRVQFDDVMRVLGTPDVTPASSGPAAQALPPMRRAMARAMTLSNATIPQFIVERSVDWTVLEGLRSKFSAGLPQNSPRLSVNDFLLQAVARTLVEYPALNAIFSGDPDSSDARIVPAIGAHIGLVLAVANGLLVPVLHDVERLGLTQIARRRVDCVERGLKGRLKREEVDGATISLSNLGAEGPDRFTAIINPPQSAILAVGRQRDCVVARDGELVVRPRSALTLTVDHRVADGRLAANFLACLVEILEGRDWVLD